MKKGFAHVLILLAGIVVVGVAAVSFLAGKGFSGSVFLPSEPSPSTAQTSDPIAEWETYQGESLLFRHPEGWSVTKGSVEYYGGEAVLIKNPKKTVTLTVYPAINNTYPYGFGNPEIQKDIVKVMFGGKSYDVEEITVDNRALYAEVVNDGKYSFLFGTGYPSGASELASLEDYNRDKNTILQILSTFEFRETLNTLPPTLSSASADTTGWQLYSNAQLGIQMYVPTISHVTTTKTLEEISVSKSGDLLLQNGMVLVPNTWPSCENNTSDKQFCILRGQDWGQTDDIVTAKLDNQDILSFYIKETKGNSIFRIIVREDNSLSIGFPVDGLGQPEKLNSILNSVKFKK